MDIQNRHKAVLKHYEVSCRMEGLNLFVGGSGMKVGDDISRLNAIKLQNL